MSAPRAGITRGKNLESRVKRDSDTSNALGVQGYALYEKQPVSSCDKLEKGVQHGYTCEEEVCCQETRGQEERCQETGSEEKGPGQETCCQEESRREEACGQEERSEEACKEKGCPQEEERGEEACKEKGCSQKKTR